MTLRLHSFWQATAPYRVRIGLNLKGLAYDYADVNLQTGVQRQEPYASLNPQQLTPALETDGQVITQSVAILEWLEDTHPQPPLLPTAPSDRAVVRAMAAIVACDIHPLNNLRVRQQLDAMGLDAATVLAWQQRWIIDGFRALDALVARHGAGFCFGDQPTLADCLLIPQVFGAHRAHVDMAAFPALAAVDARAAQHPAFIAAQPSRQPGAA